MDIYSIQGKKAEAVIFSSVNAVSSVTEREVYVNAIVF